MATIAGVRYVNDSKATNVAAALRALASFPGARKLVILGGRGKAEPYAPLAEAFAAGDRAYLIGEATEAIAAALEDAGVPFERSRRPRLCGGRGRRRGAGRATSCCSRPRARATTSSGITKCAGRSSGSWCRSSSGVSRGDSVKSRPAGQLEQRLLVLVTLGLVAFGLVMVFSATSASAALGAGDPMTFLVKQGAYALAGLLLLALASRFDYHRLRTLAPMLLVGSLFLCIAVLVVAPPINGAQRWFLVGPISVQPSELAKIAVCVWTCALLARRPTPQTLGELMKPLGLVVGLFCILILLEPDLGTTIALCLMVGGILVVSEVPFRLLALGGSIALVLGAAAIYVEPYRRARFLSFVDPWQDPQGAGFQTVQAIIGMGSGGITGEGLGQGISKIFYLPEAHTDMIFAIVGEELGLIGSTVVIAAFAVFAWAGFRIALHCRDPFGKRLAAGITTLVCGQAAINLCAVLGIAPLTGIPLPFVSYGGSSLIVLLAAVGVLLNIAVNDRVVEARSRDSGRGNSRSHQARSRSRGGTARSRSDRDVRRQSRPRRVASGS